MARGTKILPLRKLKNHEIILSNSAHEVMANQGPCPGCCVPGDVWGFVATMRKSLLWWRRGLRFAAKSGLVWESGSVEVVWLTLVNKNIFFFSRFFWICLNPKLYLQRFLRISQGLNPLNEKRGYMIKNNERKVIEGVF